MPTTTSFLPGFFFAMALRPSIRESSSASRGAAQRLRAASDYKLDHAGINVKRWRTFDGIERSNASAGAGADIDEPAASRQCVSDEFDRLRNLREGSLYGRCDLGIFGVNDASDFECGFAIKIARGGVGLFRT